MGDLADALSWNLCSSISIINLTAITQSPGATVLWGLIYFGGDASQTDT